MGRPHDSGRRNIVEGEPVILGAINPVAAIKAWRRSRKEAVDMGPRAPRFRMGRLDHVHIQVPDRAEAARWYAEHLGFEPVEALDFWASGVEGGPLQISADGGRTTLALFEVRAGVPMVRQETGVAFSVEADSFMAFARSLPCGIDSARGEPLVVDDLVDFDLCWAFDLADPWGNQYELNCYEYDRVRTELVEAGGLTPSRKWPREVYDTYSARRR